LNNARVTIWPRIVIGRKIYAPRTRYEIVLKLEAAKKRSTQVVLSSWFLSVELKASRLPT
jgi:hypothetical protein